MQASVDKTINDIIAKSVHFDEMLEEFGHFLYGYGLRLERGKFGYDVYDAMNGKVIDGITEAISIKEALRLVLVELERRIIAKAGNKPSDS